MSRSNIIYKVLSGLADAFHVWRHELKACLQDQGILIFFVLVPLGYPLLYGFIYTQEVVRDVPIVVVDEDHSSLGREFVRRVDASADVQIVARCTDMEEAQQAMREHRANGILRIPSDFSRDVNDISRWHQAHVDIYCDMSSMFYYKALYTTASSVSLDMNKEIKVRRNSALTTLRDEEINAAPVDYEYVAMFNPQSGYDGFLLPAVLILILQQTMVFGVGMRYGTLVERRRFGTPEDFGPHTYDTLSMVLGQALCYFMIYCLCALWILVCIPAIFSLPQIAHPMDLLRFSVAFIADITFFAMTVSILVRNREKPMLLFAFMSVPMLFLSGISWPGSGIPAFWKAVSWLFPSTFGINGFVRLNTLSADLGQISFEYHGLWLQAAVFFVSTCLVYLYLRHTAGSKRA